jgi:hypothetical protein
MQPPVAKYTVSAFCPRLKSSLRLGQVHDARKRQFVARSEDDADDELLSAVVVKGGRKVVVGTQSGVLSLYSWGALRDCRCGLCCNTYCTALYCTALHCAALQLQAEWSH